MIFRNAYNHYYKFSDYDDNGKVIVIDPTTNVENKIHETVVDETIVDENSGKITNMDESKIDEEFVETEEFDERRPMISV